MMRLYLYVAAACAFICPLALCNNGKWQLADYPETCAESYLCSPSGLTWPVHEKWNSHRSCMLFAHANITKLMFWGDSYIRHIFMAAVLMISDNYKNGALYNKDDRKFFYRRQFASEKKQGVLSGYEACNGTLSMTFGMGKVPSTCHPNHLQLWSEGNHPVWWDYVNRWGVNNHTDYINKFLTPYYGLCNKFLSKVESCNLYWVSTHHRYSVVFPDETPEKVKAFNLGMREFFEDKRCGNKTGYIDVYNMTESLMLNHYSEATLMTEDFMHWGMEVNLLKIQIIMHTLHNYLKLFKQIPQTA